MYHINEPVELYTPRLILRPFQVSDAADVFEFGMDKEFARFYLAEPGVPQSVDTFMEYVRGIIWEEHPHFAIALDGKVIGEVYLNIHNSDLVGELGYAIGHAYWGKGYATEAARAVLSYGFEIFGLAKVFAIVDSRNGGSIRVLEKLGMKVEGLLRSHVVRRGERADRMYFGLLREEWEAEE